MCLDVKTNISQPQSSREQPLATRSVATAEGALTGPTATDSKTPTGCVCLSTLCINDGLLITLGKATNHPAPLPLPALLQCPDEIILEIGTYVSGGNHPCSYDRLILHKLPRAALSRLSRVSKNLHSRLLATLYRDLVLTIPRNLHSLDNIRNLLDDTYGSLKMIRGISIRTRCNDKEQTILSLAKQTKSVQKRKNARNGPTPYLPRDDNIIDNGSDYRYPKEQRVTCQAVVVSLFIRMIIQHMPVNRLSYFQRVYPLPLHQSL